MAVGGDFAVDSSKKRPPSSDSDVRYIWAPDKSQTATRQLYTSGREDPYQSDDEDFKFSFQKDNSEENRPGNTQISL